MNIPIEDKLKMLQEAADKLYKNLLTEAEYDVIKKQLFKSETTTSNHNLPQFGSDINARLDDLATKLSNVVELYNKNSNTLVGRISKAGQCVKRIYLYFWIEGIVIFLYSLVYGFINGYFSSLISHSGEFNSEDFLSYHKSLNIIFIIIEVILTILFLSFLSKLAYNLSNVTIPIDKKEMPILYPTNMAKL